LKNDTGRRPRLRECAKAVKAHPGTALQQWPRLRTAWEAMGPDDNEAVEEFQDDAGHWLWLYAAARRYEVRGNWLVTKIIGRYPVLGDKTPRTCKKPGRRTPAGRWYNRTYILVSDLEAILPTIRCTPPAPATPVIPPSHGIPPADPAPVELRPKINGDMPAWKATVATILAATPGAMVTYLELAAMMGVATKTGCHAIRERVRRWQAKNRSYVEAISDPKPHQPHFRYPLSKVADLF
jgi:hypothetical protein